MKFLYEGNSLKSGVYKIVNIINGRIYVGSAKEFKSRGNAHLKSLRKGTHHNKFLQNDFNKCGEEAFEFHILETVEGPQEDRLLIEESYIEKYYDKQALCYNFKKQSKGEGRSCYSKTPEETSKKISAVALANWANPEIRKKMMENNRLAQTEEHRKNLSEIRKEQWKGNEKRKQATSEMLKKMWQEDPDRHEKTHSKEAIEKRRQALLENIKEKHKLVCSRPILKELDFVGKDTRNFKGFQNANLLSPGGILYKNITNLQDFANENNLSETKVRDITRESLWFYKGWTRYKNYNNEEWNQSNCLNTIEARSLTRLLSPLGEVVEGYSIVEICQKHSLERHNLRQLIRGKKKHGKYRGWVLF
jgi:group I intron endonuclease